MSAGQGLTLPQIAVSILDAVEGHFAASDNDLPERRYVAPGTPDSIAWDCEQLVVALSGVGWGQAEDLAGGSLKMGTQSNMAVRHAVFNVQLIRCTPSVSARGQAPTADKLHAAGLQFMRDAGMLSQALVEACRNVATGFDRTAMVQPGTVEPGPAEGGYQGIEAVIAVTSGQLL
jgi:hypothetical protein